MKLLLTLRICLGLLAGVTLLTPAGVRAQDSDTPLNPDQVDQLMGPIALYPDALVALILPASATPGDIVLAARYLDSGGSPDQIDSQPWSESIKALARYPILIKWLDENLAWTQQLGQTFLSQPDEVMNAVQRLRARARAAGTLTSTSQQKIVLDGDIIRIEPAQPEVIYVPYYDPQVVYVTQPPYYGYPYLTFGVGFPVGIWLSYDVDWHRHAVWVGDSRHNWHNRSGWDHHYPSGNTSGDRAWHRWTAPTKRPPYAKPDYHRPRGDMPRPNSVPGAPSNLQHNPQPRDSGRSDGHRDSGWNHPPTPSPSTQPQPSRDNRGHGHNDRPPTPPQGNEKPELVPAPGPTVAVPPPPRSHGPGLVPTPPPSSSPNPLPGPVPDRTGQHGPPRPPEPGNPSAPAPRHDRAPSHQPPPPPPAPPPPQNPKDQQGKDPQATRVQN